MPISDEIIELEPVKKNRPKFIILIVVAAVMLALAVTFLVMYLVKPNVEEDPGPLAKDITINTEGLFLSEYESDTPVYSVSGGNTYTVSAFVSAEEGAIKDVNWRWSANEAISYDHTEKADADGKALYSFTVNPAYAAAHSDTMVTLTARSSQTSEVFQSIKIRVVDQKTENIILGDYYWSAPSVAGVANSVNSNRFAITNDTITIADVTRATYNVLFEQKGKANVNGEYNDISYGGSEGNSITATLVNGQNVLSNPQVVRQTSAMQQTGLLSFKVQGPGTATIMLNAAGASRALTVNVETTSAHNVIEQIYVYDEPVYHYDAKNPENNDLRFFEEHSSESSKLPSSSNNLILPYTSAVFTYGNIMEHIVLYPLSLQYDKETGKMKEGWEKLIKISSDSTKTNPGAIRVNNTLNQITTQQLSKDISECALLIEDASTSSFGAYAAIGVNVVAGSRDGTLTLARGDYKWDKEIDMSETGITAAQNDVFTYSVSYNINADPKTEVNNFIDKHFLYPQYKLEFDDDITVKVGNATLESGKIYSLGNEFKVTHPVESSNNFVGTIDFAVIISGEPKEGEHTVKFTRIGSPFGTIGTNNYDPSWEKIVKFNVTQQSDTVDFAPAEVLLSKITNGGEYAGSYKINTAPTSDNGFTGTMDIYIQHLSQNSGLWFDFADLVYVNGGTANKSVTCVAVNPPSGTNLPFRIDNGKFSFTLTPSYSNGFCRAEVAVRNEGVSQNLGKLTINVNVIDAYKNIECENASETKYYSATPTADDYYEKTSITASLTVNKQFDGRYEPYTNIGDVDIAYAGGISLNGEWNAAHDEKTFTREGDDTVLFKYTRSLGVVPQVNLFTYAYNNIVDIHTVIVTYTMSRSNDAYYVGNTPLSCFKTVSYVRKADDIKLYSDLNYTKEITPGENGKQYAYGVNNEDYATLAITAVINVDTAEGDKPIIIRKETSAFAPNIFSGSYIPTYITIDEDASKALNQTVSSGEHEYINFKTPALGDRDSANALFGIKVNGATSDMTIDFTVENYSRSAQSVRFLDGDGKEISLLQFGHTWDDASNKYYEKSVFVEITYDARDDKYTKFASIRISFPDFIKAHLYGDENWKYEPIEFYPSKLKYDDEACVETVEVIFALNKDVINPEIPVQSNLKDWDDDIFITGGKVNSQLSFISRTSVSDVWYTKYDGVNKPIVDQSDWITTKSYNSVTLTFDLNAENGLIGSAKEQTLRFRFVSYASEHNEYATWVDTGREGFGFYVSGLIYDKEQMNLEIHDVTQNADALAGGYVGPLKWDPNKNTRMVSVNPVLTEQYLTAGRKEYSYRFDFTDSSCINPNDVTSVGKVFTLNVKVIVNVTYDVYHIEQQDGQYDITTNGEKVDEQFKWQNKTVTVVLNTEDKRPSMSEADVASVKVELVKKNGESYEPFTDDNIRIISDASNGIKFNGNKITGYILQVRDNVTSLPGDIYVMAKCGELTSYSQVYVNTYLYGVRINECNLAGDGSFNVQTKTADVYVAARNSVNKLVAEVYNLGSGAADTAKTVTYKLYSDSACSAEIDSGVAVSANGEIVFTNPVNVPGYNSANMSGTLYYKASYGDVSYIVTVNYHIQISSMELVGLDDSVFNSANGVISLYYTAGGYTYVDLSGCANVVSVFDNRYSASIESITVSGSSVRVSANNEIIPLSTGASDITVATEYNGHQVSQRYRVQVSGVTVFDFDKDSDTVYAINGNTVGGTAAVTATAYPLHGLRLGQYGFVLNGESACVSVAVSDYTANISIDKSKLTDADYKTYTFTASLAYEPMSAVTGKTGAKLNGNITVTKQFALAVDGSHAPTFTVTHGTNNINSSAEVSKADGGVYRITVGNRLADAVYTATVISGGNIISIGDFDGNGEATISFGNANGRAEFKVTATVYGKVYESDSFVLNVSDGRTVNVKITDASGNDVSGTSVDINYSSTAPTFKYEIDASAVGATVDASAITIKFASSVDGAVQPLPIENKGGNKFEVAFSVVKPTALTVIGTVSVNGVVYDLQKTVAFVAVEPAFKPVRKNDTAELTSVELESKQRFDIFVIKTAGTLTDFTVIYSFVGDQSSYIDLQQISGSKDCTITAKTIDADRHIVLRAVVTVNGGAYDGATHTYDIDVMLKAVAMPVLSWSGVTTDVFEAGGSYNLANMLSLKGSDYAFAYEIKVNGSSDNNAAYTLNGGMLTVNNCSALAAGGTIEVKAIATIRSGANAGRTVDASYTFRVKPTATVGGVTVSGKKGAHALTPTVTVNCGTESYQLKENDRYVVVYAVDNNSRGASVVNNELVFADYIQAEGVSLGMKANIAISSGVYDGCVIVVPFTVTVMPVALKQVSFYTDDTTSYATVEQVVGETYVLPDEPTRTGYTFEGWYTDTSYTTSVTESAVVTAADTAMLYAKWGAVTVTVRLTATPGSVGMSTVIVIFGDPFGSLPTPTRTGYSAEWQDAEGNIVDENTTVSQLSYDLHAVWTANTYTLTFDPGQGRLSGNSTKNVTFDSPYGDLPTATYTGGYYGYSFDGWVMSNNEKITSSQTVTITSDITLYATYKNWRGDIIGGANNASATNIITFNANGGEFVGDAYQSIVCKIGDAYGYVPANTSVTRTGYTFNGWYILNNDATKTFVTAETTASSPNQYVVVYADWLPKTVIVTFEAQGNPNRTANVTFGTAIGSANLAAPSVVPTGYAFGGWKDKSGAVYSEDTKVTVESLTLAAIWNKVSYTVVFDANGGTLPSDAHISNSYTYDTEYTLPTPTRTGYGFVGWYNGTQTVNGGTKVKATANVVYTAQWNVTVSFELDYAGAGAINPVTVICDTAIGSQMPADPERTGYAFGGWKDGNGTVYTAQTHITAPLTLTAVWNKVSYTVVFDANGGSLPSGVEILNSYEYDAEYTLPTPTRTGYNFVGWNNGTTNVAADTKVNATADVVYTAQWTEIEYVTVVYYLDGGSMSGDTIVKVQNGTSYVLPTPTRTGYSFDGWYIGSNKITDTTATANGDVIYTAHWIANDVTVSFDLDYTGEGVTAPASVTIKYDTALGNKLPADPERTGYTFGGWKDADGTVYTAQTVITESLTLTAVWTQNSTDDETEAE